MPRMFRSFFALTAVALLLSACGSSHRITYSGHEESTEGVPGFVNGKKVSPNVKLGQAYEVDGDTYVPRFQPDYVEEGMASWYGPGFHGGKTANGEEFDTHTFTAAHRTLPLPSIVKVTMVESGKSVYVRINDRGPYAKGRIIDLSYGAAKEIGLVAKGTGKVRVEYMLAESQRFADLLAQGRAPDSIDVASEVLPYAHQASRYAQNAGGKTQIASSAGTIPPVSGDRQSFSEHLNPIASARATEVPPPANIPENRVDVADANPPVAVITPANVPLAQSRGDPPPAAQVPPPLATSPPPMRAASQSALSQAPPGGVYVQLGTFSQHSNALRMQRQAAPVGQAVVVPKSMGNALWYRVRMGPYDPAHAKNVATQLHQSGIQEAAIVSQ